MSLFRHRMDSVDESVQNPCIRDNGVNVSAVSKSFQTIAVLGAGSWGTALANTAARAGRHVTLWGRDASAVQAMQTMRENSRYLPGVELHESLQFTTSLDGLKQADAILSAVPAQAQRAAASSLKGVIAEGAPIIICAKGIERGSHRFMSEVISEALPGHAPVMLSGPSFADDVARGLPTAVTIAAEDESLAEALGLALATPTFRLYHTSDLRGVEIGGAAKNVLAIACGIASGAGLGASANAALIARGFAELRRFGAACGARPETLMGLSGLGDLVLTCGSAQSRNFAFGFALGKGAGLAEASGGKLAEGALTAPVIAEMARARMVDMPICMAVEALLDGRLDVRSAIGSLLARPQKSEM